MSILRIASRYAQSLFELSKEANSLDKVHEDVLLVAEVAKNADFAHFLKNPVISVEKKKNVFNAYFADKLDALTLKTLTVIVEHKRESYLKDFCRTFHLLYNRENKISSARLVTAVEMSAATVEELITAFKNKGLLDAQVELEQVVDDSIIGGFILEFDGQVYNASLAYKLDQMRTKFSENLYIKNL